MKTNAQISVKSPVMAHEYDEQKVQLRAAADASWQHYQATGKHITLAEANAWLDKTIAGQDAGKL